MNIVTISSKNQITIPKDILTALFLSQKEKLLVEKKEEAIILRPLRKSVVQLTAGSLTKYVSPSKLKKTLKEIEKETKKKVAYKIARSL